MKKTFYICFLLLGATILFSSCSKDDESISELIIGTWNIDNDQTSYREGLLAGLTGIDQATIETILSTTATVFNNSTIAFKSDMTGAINKNIIKTDNAGSILGDILGSITNNLVKLNYTYSISKGKLILDINTITDQTYELNIVSITEDKLVISMTVTDLSSWTSVILGDAIGEAVSGVAQSEIFKKIDALSGQFLGISTNPTVVMTYYKK